MYTYVYLDAFVYVETYCVAGHEIWIVQKLSWNFFPLLIQRYISFPCISQ